MNLLIATIVGFIVAMFPITLYEAIVSAGPGQEDKSTLLFVMFWILQTYMVKRIFFAGDPSAKKVGEPITVEFSAGSNQEEEKERQCNEACL